VNAGEQVKNLNCRVSQLDVSSQSSLDAFKKSFGDGPLDLLLNIAGMCPSLAFVYVHSRMVGPPKIPSTPLLSLSSAFSVNTFGPVLLTQAMLPNLLRSPSPKVGFMSSGIGSIGDKTTNGAEVDMSSRAALNSMVRSLATELKGKGVVVVSMHPGYAGQGDAGKWWSVLRSKGLDDTGKCWGQEGQELPS
jgi:NAD(P)-dependent dehydrogenase (short-subunit alcohol dehydrogenase family)